MNKILDKILTFLGMIGLWGGIILFGIGFFIPMLRNAEYLDPYSGWLMLVGALMVGTIITAIIIQDKLDDKKKSLVKQDKEMED